MAQGKRSRVVTIIMVAVALAVWSFMLMYPWPVVPMDDTKHPVDNLPADKPRINLEGIQRLHLSLAVTQFGVAVVTFTNKTQNVIAVYDNRRFSAYTLIVSPKDSPPARYRLEDNKFIRGLVTEMPLLPGTSYSREINLEHMLQKPVGTISLAIAYQPGGIDQKYAITKELLSNSVPWMIEAPKEDKLMEVLE